MIHELLGKRTYDRALVDGSAAEVEAKVRGSHLQSFDLLLLYTGAGDITSGCPA